MNNNLISSAERWPSKLTPELEFILGRPRFMFISLAATYRKAGYEIAAQAEAEQAFCMHRMLTHWFEHGENWRSAMQAEINDIKARADALIVAEIQRLDRAEQAK